ncbi:MAG: hypothetical protein JW738_00045 [Actinobacteria bacterium]|nr:hypothetical protein [Actinomycetota bacterium]
MRAGRRPKLTKELQERICQLISAGNYIKTACQASGISEQTYINWKKWGEKRSAGIYFEFFEAVKKAEATAIARNIAVIQTASRDSWQAAAWWLERKYPKEWGRKGQLELQAPDIATESKADAKTKLISKLTDIASNLGIENDGKESSGNKK